MLEDRIVPSGDPALTGSWSSVPSIPTGSPGTMLLLPNGTVMVQGANDNSVNSWYALTPNASGSYANGSWSQLGSMNVGRLFFGSAVLPSDQVFVVGGEYSSTGGFNGTGEVYDMASNSWTMTPNFPLGGFGDDPTDVLPNGNILCGFVGGPQTEFYNPSTSTWSPGPTKLDGDGSDEETWVKLPVSPLLPQGGILSYSIFASLGGAFKGQVLNIATNTWTETKNSPTNPPGPLSSNNLGAELGGGVMLPNGNVFLLGATGNTALYNPTTNLWSAGPQILDSNNNLLGCDDAPVSILPDGQVVFAADFGPTNGTFSGPTELFDYDYTSNTITQIPSSSLPATLAGDLGYSPAFVDRTLVLPNGQMLFNDGGNLFTFTPSDSPQNAWRPAITGITSLGGGAYTMTGTQLSGISEGSSYGDDVNVSEDYPVVQLTAKNGNVYYATTSNWSNMLVSPVGDATPESVDFTLPGSIASTKGAYQLSVSASGISSNPQTFYIGTPVTVAAQNASTTYSTNKQTLSLSANVTPSISSPTVGEGTVTFTIKNSGGATIGGTTANVKGGVASANFTLPANEPAGLYTIAVSYSDPTGPFFDNGDSSGTLTILPAKVSTVANPLTASYSPNSQTLTLSAVLTDNSNSGDTVNEGNVTFTVAGIGTFVGKVIPGAISGGTASVSFTLPAGQAPGVYSILVSYSDSAGNYIDNGDTKSTFTISPANAVTTAVNSPAAYSINSQTLTLNANVADASIPGDVINEGTVTFTIENGTTPVGTPVSVPVFKGTASAFYNLPAGQSPNNYTIAVSYSDSLGNFADGGDNNAILNLTPARAAIISSAANTPQTDFFNSSTHTITLSAAVLDNSFTTEAVNEGTVSFTVESGKSIIGTPVVGVVTNSAASAVYTVPAGLPLGSYTIVVAYTDGLGNYADNGDTNGTLVIAPANVTVAAGSPPLSFSTHPQTVTLTAAVTNASKFSDIVNEGVVTFTVKDGSQIIGNVQGTVSGGNASATFGWSAGRAAGTYTIAVSYSDSAGNFFDTGDTNGALNVAPANVTTTANNPTPVVHSSSTQSITLTANVANATFSSDTVNEGAVTFTIEDGKGNTIGTPVQGNVSGGKASAVYTLPAGQAVGGYAIVVSYKDGQGNFSDSGDTNGTLSVGPADAHTTANNVSAVYSPNGQTLNLSANVANVSVPSQLVGEGVVTFKVEDSKGNQIGSSVTGNVSGGKASASYALPAGQAASSYTIVVSYSDSQGSFFDSGDTSGTLTLAPANVTTTANALTASFSPNAQTLNLSAAVADASIPSDTVGAGVVTFTVKTSTLTLGSVNGTVLGGKVVADFALAAGQPVGSYIIAVSYNDGAGNYLDSGDSNALLTLAPANVATTAASIPTVFSPNQQTLNLSATIADTSIPTDKVDEGVVTFTIKNGSTTLGNVQAAVNAGAVSGGTANAKFTLPAGQAAGSYTIAVSYSDSSVNFSDNSDTNGTLTVSPANVTATANLASAVYSTNSTVVKLSANVVDDSVPSDKVNEGIVTFTIMNGKTVLGTATGTVAGGTANAALTLPAGLTPGSYTVNVSYADSNSNFISSGSGGGSSEALTVAAANVATAAVPNSAAVYSLNAQTVTLNANVADVSVPSDTINEGVVTFTISSGSTVIGSVQGTVNSGSASAQFTLPAGLAAGSYVLAVSYSDSQGFFSDSGDTYAALTVSPANATTTAAAAHTTFSAAPQTVMLSANVADPGPVNNVVNSGFVTFTIMNGSTAVASGVGAVNGGTTNAALTLPGSLAAGNYTIVVSYNGQGNFADDGDDYSTLTVGAAGTSAQLTQATLAPTLLSLTATETLTAHVNSSTAVTQGSVTFVVSGHTITANVDGNGNATAVVSVPMLQLLGPQDVSVQYNDAANNLTASSNTQTASWRIFNPIVPSTATITPVSESVTADLFGLFITYTNGVLTEIDYGSIHLVFSYNAGGGLAQVTYNGMNLLS